jgi:hypothetical protein
MSQTFEDLDLIHCGSEPCKSLFLRLKHRLSQPLFHTTIRWAAANSNYQIFGDGVTLKKSRHGDWDHPNFSTTPITCSTYFQVKIKAHSPKNPIATGGLFVGVSKTNKIPATAYTHPEHAICMFNAVSHRDGGVITYVKDNKATRGDIIGVVVDYAKEKILFYVNGAFIGEGTRKPSQMQPMYAITWMYYEGCELEVGDFIPFRELEQTL